MKRLAVVVAAVLCTTTGCSYIGVLRRQAVDIVHRRQERISRSADVILTVIDRGSDTDVSAEMEVAAIVEVVREEAVAIKQDAERSTAWLEPMKKELNPIADEKRIELDTDAEVDANTSYCGLSDSKAHTLRWWRTTFRRIGVVVRGLRYTYRVVKLSLVVAVLCLAVFGFIEWRGNRRERRARRDAIDALDDVKRKGATVQEATKNKPALKDAFEGDRAWRGKHPNHPKQEG